MIGWFVSVFAVAAPMLSGRLIRMHLATSLTSCLTPFRVVTP